MKNKSNRNIFLILTIVSLFILISLGGVVVLGYYYYKNYSEKDNSAGYSYNWDDNHEIRRFESEDEFVAYLEEVSSLESYTYTFSGRGGVDDLVALEESASSDGKEVSPTVSNQAGETGTDVRYSETNVQVEGIDEPDIVKTDGKSLFISNEDYPISVGSSVRCDDEVCSSYEIEDTSYTKVINVLPLEEMGIVTELEKGGQLLLAQDVLVVLGSDKVKAFDITESVPVERWEYEFADGVYLETARSQENELYLIFRKVVNQAQPCPMPLLEGRASDLELMCTDIYHPTVPVPTDTVYSVIKMDINNGSVQQRESFVGSSSRSVIYMTENNIYITYSFDEGRFGFSLSAVKEAGDGIFPSSIINKINNLDDLDISDVAKNSELNFIINNYYQTLSQSELIELEEKLSDKMFEYLEAHSRELTSTGIVKLDTENLAILENAKVPGTLLNQFSMDEYEGNLRIATTSEPYIYVSGLYVDSRDLSVSDVYILDENLEKKGEVNDLGKEERIYAVRFIGEEGYVVTFRETDPFYVLNLSDPESPKMVGELKIPGYSAYLHPIDDDTILGIGREEGNVKLSMFDVSDPEAPIEKSKYVLDDYWTEVENNHHAFLLDSKHEVFFIPTGQSGYIFSYVDNKIEKIQEVDDINPKRALYIEDYLYIVGNYRVKVLDETDWSIKKDFEYAEEPEWAKTDSVEPMPMIDDIME